MSDEEYDSDMDVSEDDANYAEYYDNTEGDIETVDLSKTDPEFFAHECLDCDQVRHMLAIAVDNLSNNLQITPSLAKILLQTHDWAIPTIILKYKDESARTAMVARMEPRSAPFAADQSQRACRVCTAFLLGDQFHSLACGHPFCKECWTSHFEVKICQGVATGISCMAQDCEVPAPEDFVLRLVKPALRDKYTAFAFRDCVRSHPQLRFCPGANCSVVVSAKEPRAKRAVCAQCSAVFCFKCGTDYHAPTDCVTIKRWLTKCADDSETANYISAHTKDCPKCSICIEKNGGCNHMQCYACKFDFCWMCLGDWKTHGSEYYECSRYKDNPGVATQSAHAQAREALKKYLHYYERWENHSKSLALEQETLQKIRARIETKVMSASGTWIDWQYLLDAATLLVKCRYTLQYTYPFAYYLDQGRKSLFEYQQTRLEAEIENLSWKIERAETTDRADLENQMDIAEKRRTTLLKEFLVI